MANKLKISKNYINVEKTMDKLENIMDVANSGFNEADYEAFLKELYEICVPFDYADQSQTVAMLEFAVANPKMTYHFDTDEESKLIHLIKDEKVLTDFLKEYKKFF